MTFTEEFESIRDAIYHKPWEDRGRIEACLSYALEALGGLGRSVEGAPCSCVTAGPDPEMDMECLQHGYAISLVRESLRRMEMRVRLGDDIPAGSSVEIPWDPPEPRYMETLDSDERRGY